MAEEQEKLHKPKAKLIKHRKIAPAQLPSEPKPDKMKVVVVKKKPKKAVPKVVNQVDLEKEKTPSVKSPGSPARVSPSDVNGNKPRQNPPPPAEQREGPQIREAPQRSSQARTESSSRIYQKKTEGKSFSKGNFRSGGPRFSSGPKYKQGYKNPAPPPVVRPSVGMNLGPPRGGGPPKPRIGGPPRGRTPEFPANEARAPGKKFFKTKKPTYQKKKDVLNKEKDFQIKKKSVQMTNPVPKEIDIMDVITVSNLARKMNLKASELISKLMGMGMMVTINQQIDAETAEILAEEYKCKVNIVSLYDETIIESDPQGGGKLQERPPIVTVMGHVDHGKTKLLDVIRQANVADDEFGGITQHIGAYKVSLPSKEEIVFLDTPGHEAFTLMRARGAEITDIVVLVVAANDGIKSQTIEAIDHAKAAKVPIIVAISKCDLPEANPAKVKQQLSERELMPHDWGGTTLFLEISALKRQGIDELLESIILQAGELKLKANYSGRAEGKVIESKVDHGRGIVASVIIEKGTLQVGDPFVAGTHSGKVRAIFNDRGKKIDEAPPATPVEILGLSGVPKSGAPFQVTESEKVARQVGVKRQELEKHGEALNVKKITLDNLYDSIQDGAIKEFKVIIKGDVHGSVEALKSALEKLSTEEIRLTVIRAAAGAIIENDVNLAATSNAIIIGFHVRPTPKAQTLAELEKVDIRKYNVIFDCVEDIRAAMEGLLTPELKEEILGTVEVREVFKVPKLGLIAGCYVTTGSIARNSSVHIYREGVEISTGKVTSLKRFKDDVKKVEKGFECGIGIERYLDVKAGDLLEVFEIHEIAKKLESAK